MGGLIHGHGQGHGRSHTDDASSLSLRPSGARWGSPAVIVALVGGALALAGIGWRFMGSQDAKDGEPATAASRAVAQAPRDAGASAVTAVVAAGRPAARAPAVAPSHADAKVAAPTLRPGAANPGRPVAGKKKINPRALAKAAKAARLAAARAAKLAARKKGKPVAAGPAPANESQNRMAGARSAYDRGTAQLNGGDAASAVASYREALHLFSGYTAAYRGLGLAEARLGKTREALEAFGTYCRLLPDAPDVPLLKRRMATLEKSGK